jgi:hypothetical protein
MSSRLFGEFFFNLAKEGKKEDQLQRFLCMVKPRRGHGLHQELLCTQLGLAWVLNPIMPMALILYIPH